jgi:hypothetical protein
VSVNKALPYLFVLPEDDANRQLAIGFNLNIEKSRQMQVLKVAGGWREVLNLFTSVHIAEMERDANRFMVLLIDFDGKLSRLETVRAAIPDHLGERVFVLGALTTPEALRQALRQVDLDSYEGIGSELAADCRDETDKTWRHDLLRHNSSEVDRLRTHVRPILF